MSWVLKGLSCLGAPRWARLPPQLPGGEWKVAVGEVDKLLPQLRETLLCAAG